MSRVKPEPVGNTCPRINHCIKSIEEIVSEMDSFGEEDELSVLLDSIQSWKSTLEDIGIGHSCDFEKLRDANYSLRSWGGDMQDYLEEEEEKNNDLENKIEKLEEEIEILNEKIEELTIIED